LVIVKIIMDRAANAKKLTANNRLLILTNFPDIFTPIYLSTDSLELLFTLLMKYNTCNRF